MNRNVEKLIPQALSVIKSNLIIDQSLLLVEDEMGGYASSFGATLRQAGLLPAVAFFSDFSGGNDAKTRKQKFLIALLKVVDPQYNGTLPKPIDFVIGKTRQPDEKRKFIQQLNDASIALKLALRTFQVKKS